MPQIKVTIDDKIYKQLKKEAKDNFRTITNEINYRLQQSFTHQPQPTPQSPTYIPHGTPGGIPAEPYKITLSADTTPAPANTKPSTTQNRRANRTHIFKRTYTDNHYGRGRRARARMGRRPGTY